MPIRALPNGRPIPPHSLVAIDRNSGRHRPESVVVFNRNSWSPSTGTGGRLQSKRPVVFNRNSWSPSAGVRSNSPKEQRRRKPRSPPAIEPPVQDMQQTVGSGRIIPRSNLASQPCNILCQPA